jgi:hypothetical protein
MTEEKVIPTVRWGRKATGLKKEAGLPGKKAARLFFVGKQAKWRANGPI